ncbi:hypothetical protein [Pelagicoccus sp. SDUM812002]|uniref:hypothetical protein n=1 Tax=Pelagicoccus sp. SDUM812002 TaxID=3041266 RepID=UPI00280F4052|nr:hypothetical protein [Pelagicoccus sp. SDUM812002]MDQ8186787.1 hypothetical protein [Pelagicoccus sp. SDUM812002]
MAVATFSAPNPFGHWLLETGYNLDDTESIDSRGISLAVLYAFNYAPDTHPGMPWSFATEADSLIVSLQLPAQGLRTGIRVEVSDDLASESWRELGPDDFLDDYSNLDRYANGTRRIRLPDTKSQFYRIVPESTTNE